MRKARLEELESSLELRESRWWKMNSANRDMEEGIVGREDIEVRCWHL